MGRDVLFTGYAGALLVIACLLDRLARQSASTVAPTRDFTATGPNEKWLTNITEHDVGGEQVLNHDGRRCRKCKLRNNLSVDRHLRWVSDE